MTFSEQIIYAMFKPSKYKELLELKKSRAVGFIIVMMLVLGIVTFVVPTGAYIAGFGGFTNLFENKLGSIKYNDDKLVLDKPFEVVFGSTHVLIDTEDEMVSDDKLVKNGVYFAIGSKKLRLAFVTDRHPTDYNVIMLGSILPNGLDSKMLVDFIPGIYLYLVITFLFTCAGFFIKYGFLALICSIWINSVNHRLELGLSFGDVFLICFYGQTFSMVLVNFNAALGLLPGMLVSIVSMFIAINIISAATIYMNKGNQI